MVNIEYWMSNEEWGVYLGNVEYWILNGEWGMKSCELWNGEWWNGEWWISNIEYWMSNEEWGVVNGLYSCMFKMNAFIMSLLTVGITMSIN